MLEAINRIEKYAARGRQAFETDELIQEGPAAAQTSFADPSG
jgi:hypothetical protein